MKKKSQRPLLVAQYTKGVEAWFRFFFESKSQGSILNEDTIITEEGSLTRCDYAQKIRKEPNNAFTYMRIPPDNESDTEDLRIQIYLGGACWLWPLQSHDIQSDSDGITTIPHHYREAKPEEKELVLGSRSVWRYRLTTPEEREVYTLELITHGLREPKHG